MSQTNHFHLSNESVYQLQKAGVKIHYLGQSWEDRNLESIQAAEALFDLLDVQTPGKFVLINTGDYFIPTCKHEKCETYDANYCLVAITAADWEQHRVAVLGFDQAWRTDRKKCKEHRTLPTLALYWTQDCWYCGTPEVNGVDEHGRHVCAAHEVIDLSVFRVIPQQSSTKYAVL